MTQSYRSPSHESSGYDPARTTVPYQGIVYDRDQEHLKILSICWYVMSGIAVLFGTFPLIHVGLGLFFVLGGPTGPGGPPPFIGWIFVGIGSLFVLFGWTMAILSFITARSLPKRRRIMICYIAAAIVCAQIPIGTTLGIFTFIVLSRPGIKSSFS
jgi:hypothetical protein